MLEDGAQPQHLYVACRSTYAPPPNLLPSMGRLSHPARHSLAETCQTPNLAYGAPLDSTHYGHPAGAALLAVVSEDIPTRNAARLHRPS
jgi:hypothetical protein